MSSEFNYTFNVIKTPCCAARFRMFFQILSIAIFVKGFQRLHVTEGCQTGGGPLPPKKKATRRLHIHGASLRGLMRFGSNLGDLDNA